jgi:hypothetical protein
MATTTAVSIPVYQINQTLQDRTAYPYGNVIAFAGASIMAQPNSFNSLQDLQAARQPGAALIYSIVRSSTNPGVRYYSNLTVASIVTLVNA